MKNRMTKTKHYLSTNHNETNNSTRLDDQDPDATNDNEDMKNFFGRWETEDNKVESSCY